MQSRVTSLELFFDLVFVFTITELTTVLYREPTWRGAAQAVLMLGIIWWMYGGYAWMTNAVSAHTNARRLLLLGGMGGFFVLALAVARAFHGSGLAFGGAYLAVVAVHSILFTRATSVSVARAIVTLAPFNIASALVVLLGGALGGTAQYALWAAAVVFEWTTPLLRGLQGFAIGTSHFVERHGLVVLIAIGESVVAVGTGALHRPVDGALVAVAALGLALSAELWWLYFVGDPEQAESSLASMDGLRRAWAALVGYGYWHIPILLGIVAIASSERVAFARPFAALGYARASLLAGGVAAYLVGDVFFRHAVAIGASAARAGAAVLAVATIPLGASIDATAQIGLLVAILALSSAAERHGPGGPGGLQNR